MTDILRGIPIWVYLLFFLLMYKGIQAARKSNVIKLKKICIIPVVFFILAIQKIHNPSLFVLFIVIGLAIGLAIYYKTELRADKEKQLIELPGSIIPLILMLIAFGKGYFFGYEHAVHPEYGHQAWFLHLHYIVNGTVTGIFAGRALAYFLKYQKAPHTDLKEPVKKTKT